MWYLHSLIQRRILINLILLLVVSSFAASVCLATPQVTAKSWAYGCDHITLTVTAPTSPLEVTAYADNAGSSAFGFAKPGVLKASATAINTEFSWDYSYAEARFTDHFFHRHGGVPANSIGTFRYNLLLSGTLRFSANLAWCQTKVTVFIYTAGINEPAAQLNFEKVDGVPTLYARGYEDAGIGFPERNVLAGPEGEMVIYGTTSVASGGYYTMHVRKLIRFDIPSFPVNQTPEVENGTNEITIVLGTAATRDGTADFSSTLEFTEQNPILPSAADPSLPTTGWDFGTATEQISLPAPLCVSAFTGSGDVAFVSDYGLIENLTAVDPATAPAAGRPEEFPHGMFSLQITGLDVGAENTLTLTLPDDVEVGTKWWVCDATQWWTGLDLGDDDGDQVVTVALADGLIGDAGGADGILDLVGGLSSSTPTAALLNGFDAASRAGGVDLTWQVGRAANGEFLLRARKDGVAWTVAHTAAGPAAYVARDESSHLAFGGTVSYDLFYEGRSLQTEQVHLTVPERRAVLTGAAPNPFNPQTDISLVVMRAQTVRVDLFTMDGRLVARLANRVFSPGGHVLPWDGRDDAGREVSSGTYLVLLSSEGGQDSLKISLVR